MLSKVKMLSTFLLFLLSLSQLQPIESINQQPYEHALGLKYLKYSYAAYCNPNSVSSWSCKWCNESEITGVKILTTLNNYTFDAFGFVAYDKPNNEGGSCLYFV